MNSILSVLRDLQAERWLGLGDCLLLFAASSFFFGGEDGGREDIEVVYAVGVLCCPTTAHGCQLDQGGRDGPP